MEDHAEPRIRECQPSKQGLQERTRVLNSALNASAPYYSFIYSQMSHVRVHLRAFLTSKSHRTCSEFQTLHRDNKIDRESKYNRSEEYWQC